VGYKERAISKSNFKEAIRWLKEHKQIRDVLLSGGDPLTLETTKLEDFLRDIYAIPHVDLIRIGTKAPVTMPMRITSSLCNTLRSYHPLFISINFVHPREITEECKEACIKLAEAGIPLGSQTVLLKGVNDDVETMKTLMQELLKIRVRPYYIYQMDLAAGTSHFRVPIEKGLEIMENLRGWTSGYAVPQFVVDLPGGGGKVPINPNYIVSKSKNRIVFRNYKGKEFVYSEPV
jgi:lysine 2,3-aminomutase